MATEFMLTTFDNPFDPFEQFTQWRLFDIEKGYFTCERLAKLAQFREDMSQKEIDDESDRAAEQLIDMDFLNIYKKVYRTAEKAH